MNEYYNQNPYQQNAAPQNDGVYDWDSTIQQESSFVLLPAGDYFLDSYRRAAYLES